MRDRNSLIGLFLSLLLCTSFVLACNSTSSKNNTNNSNNSNTTTTANGNNSNDSSVSSTRDTTPVTIAAYDLLSAASSGSDSTEEVYKDRMVTVVSADLQQIMYDHIKVGSSSSSSYIKCEGDFSQYMDVASKIEQLRQQGKPPKATIRGVFKDISKDSYSIPRLSPCVLTDLEK